MTMLVADSKDMNHVGIQAFSKSAGSRPGGSLACAVGRGECHIGADGLQLGTF